MHGEPERASHFAIYAKRNKLRIMSVPISIDSVSIRTRLQPGDIGYVIHRHGKLYGEEYGYGISFETYVAAGLFEFYNAYDPSMDQVWICEHKDQIVGFLLLAHREKNSAQLRYFYLERDYRGIGLGKKLMSLFIEFLVQHGYESAYLWTTHEQDAAASLYKRFGFKLTDEKPSTAFGKALTEQKYVLTL